MFIRNYQKKIFFHSFARVFFVISDIVFGCDDPTYNPNPDRELSLLTQFSGFTTLQSLDLEKQCKGAWSTMILFMRSNNLTYNPSPSNS